LPFSLRFVFSIGNEIDYSSLSLLLHDSADAKTLNTTYIDLFLIKFSQIQKACHSLRTNVSDLKIWNTNQILYVHYTSIFITIISLFVVAQDLITCIKGARSTGR
jgi:hypothetical protein